MNVHYTSGLLTPKPWTGPVFPFTIAFLFRVKSYVFELDHGPIQNFRPLTPYRLLTVNIFTAFPYATGCEVRYCFVIFLRVPQFWSPLHAWYNLGLMPPSSTQVAGDRFNPSFQVFFANEGGEGADLDTVQWSWSGHWSRGTRHSIRSMTHRQETSESIQVSICSRYTKENPKKDIDNSTKISHLRQKCKRTWLSKCWTKSGTEQNVWKGGCGAGSPRRGGARREAVD